MFTALKEQTSLNRQQIESIFCEERARVYADAPTWESMLTALQEIPLHEKYQPLKDALSIDDIPDEATLSALATLPERVQQKEDNLHNYLQVLAQTRNLKREELVKRYSHELKGVSKGPGLRQHSHCTEANIRVLEAHDIPNDPATVVALSQLVESLPQPQPGVMSLVPGREGVTSCGYDQETGRLELHFDNIDTPFTYQNVTPLQWARLQNENVPVSDVLKEIIANPTHQYASSIEERRAGHVNKCEGCGRFRGATHECPELLSRQTPMEERLQASDQDAPEEQRKPGRPRKFARDYSPSDAYRQVRESMTPHEEDLAVDAWVANNDLRGATEPQELTEYDIKPDMEATRRAVVLNDLQRYRIFRPNRYDEVQNVPGDVPQFKNSAMLVLVNNDEFHYVREFELGQYITNQSGTRLTHRGHYDRRGWKSERARDVRLESLYEETDHVSIERRVYLEDEDVEIEPFRFRTDDQELIKENTLIWGGGVSSEELHETWNDGEAWESPIAWSGHVKTSFVDATGQDMPVGSFEVTGALAVNAHGVVSGEHELRCSCESYARRYTCQHIRYIMTYGHVPVMRIADERYGKGVPVEENPYPEELNTQPGFSVSKDDGVLVAHIPSLDFTSVSDFWSHEDISVPSKPEVKSNEALDAYASQLQKAVYARNLIEGYTVLEMSEHEDIMTGLEYGDVEAEVYSRNLSTEGFTLTGSVRLTKEGEHVEAVSSRLRCSCGRFMSENGCAHTHLATEALLKRSNGRYNDNTYVTGTMSEVEHLAEDIKIINRMNHIPASEGFSEGERYLLAEEIIEAENKALEEEQLAIAEERARALKEEQELTEEQLQHYTQEVRRRASLVKQSHELWEQTHPEYAAYHAEREQAWEHREHVSLKSARDIINDPVRSAPRETVTDGICAPGQGNRKFGLELEVVFPNMTEEQKKQALQSIVQEVKALGLTEQDHIGVYHSGTANDWTSWSIEEDLTVDLEIVTPPLSDTPEDWKKMEQVLEIVKRHGGRSGPQAGLHVNISTGSMNGNFSSHVELIRTLKEHEDTLFRAAANPETGVHRGEGWCTPHAPIPDVKVGLHDSNGVMRAMTLHTGEGHRKTMVNIGNSLAEADDKARAEVRIWDSTLDLAAIQDQVAVSAALIDHAERTVRSQGDSAPRDAFVRGENSGDEVSDEALGNAVSLAHKLFRQESDQRMFLNMFAHGSWADKTDANTVSLASVLEL